jgi:RNA polymerase sigma-70 factor (ECF subfamily)
MSKEEHIPGFSIEALKAGDEKAFERLLHYFYTALCYFSEKITNNWPAAEEVVEDTFMKVWQRHTDFENVSSIKAFLYISIRNSSLNFLDRSSHKRKHEQYLAAISEPLEEDVLNEIIRTEVLNEIYQAINDLPEECSRIFKLLYQGNKKPKEIAQQLNISVSTVNSQKQRGLILLRKKLSGKSFELLLSILFI